MNKRVCRYFAGFMHSQARWLNKMSAEGYRLVRTTLLHYEFEPCSPKEYEYAVEYIGHMTPEHMEEYKSLLEDLGYRSFYKNININYSAGKVYRRPGAEPGGEWGTSETTMNKELLIVEKKKDGTPFELHTTFEDRLLYTLRLRTPWIWFLVFLLILFLIRPSVFMALLVALDFAFVIRIQLEIERLKKVQKQRSGNMTKQKLDKNGIKIILCLLVVAIIVVVRLFVPSYTSVRSCTRIGYIGKENKHQWSGSYQSLNGTMTKKLKPENDTLTVTIETESGDLSITIKDMEDQILFEETNLTSGSHEIDVTGDVIIKITAAKHKGSFTIQ